MAGNCFGEELLIALDMTSPILEDIKVAISKHKLITGTVHISLSKNVVEEEFENGQLAMVRWLCWSIDNQNGYEVVEPTYEVCCPDLTLEEIQIAFGERLDGLSILFDHDIGV